MTEVKSTTNSSVYEVCTNAKSGILEVQSFGLQERISIMISFSTRESSTFELTYFWWLTA